jgi:transmembrane sensor
LISLGSFPKKGFLYVVTNTNASPQGWYCLVALLNMELDRILELLAKQIGNAATHQDLAELERLLQQHPNHQHLVSILKSIQGKKLKQPAQNEDLIVREGWEKLQQKLGAISGEVRQSFPKNEGVRPSFLGNALRWAPAFMGLVFFAITLYFLVGKSRQPNTVASLQETVPRGKPEMSQLPDGSIIWINAGSKIRYIAEQNTRDVYLEGEAYFKVKHDAEHPFVVHAGNITVRALGTEFNVSAYPEENVAATLITGKVQVTIEEKPDQKIILVPNEKFTITNKRTSVRDSVMDKRMSYEVKPATALPALNELEEIAWTHDKLAFQNETFDELARRMERRYNVHIVFYSEALKKETLSGIFENENIERALRILQMTTPFQFHIKTDSVYLKKL